MGNAPDDLIVALIQLKRDKRKIDSALVKKMFAKPEMKERLSQELSRRIREANVYNEAVDKCVKIIKEFFMTH